MRVLIQNCDTLEFLTADQRWTPSLAEAKDFQGTLAATRAIRERQLNRAQILLDFGRADLDLVLPLGECKDPARN